MTWIQTHSGKRFDLLAPHPSMVDITDIAHALSNICRFNGHTREFYSVAQHSVLVSRLVPPPLALVGLLHDATEAYIGDVTRPLKALLPDYKLIEQRIWFAIAVQLDVCGHAAMIPRAVKEADNIALVTERRDLMNHCHHAWDEYLEAIPPDPHPIHPLLPDEARAEFIDRFVGLTEGASA